MLTVDDYGKIRRAHRDGLSIREIARTFRRSRRKIRQILKEPEPAPYVRRVTRAPKLGPLHATIDQILAADEDAPRKQRHTAMQVFRRLVAEHAYDGGYDSVRRYIGKHRRRHSVTFIPLDHEPGQRMECDFGKIYVDFPEGRRQIPVLLLAWSYSYAPFAMAMPTERVESILAGMVAGFEFFDCVAREVWWDNPRTVATEILKGRERRMHDRYAALASHYCIDPKFCMPASGWEKPCVENRVYDLQRRWTTPVPRMANFDELNSYLLQCCMDDLNRTVAGQSETIGARFERDKAAALRLPAYGFDPCVTAESVVDHYQRVRYDRARYSVPRGTDSTVTIKAYPHEIRVVNRGVVIAEHARCYDGGQELNPLHYLVTLSRRPAAIDHSNVYRNWELPPIFKELRAQMEESEGAAPGVRRYIQVLQLLVEHSTARVAVAIAAARRDRVLTVARIEHHLRLTSQDEPRDEPIDCAVDVPMPDLNKFDHLLTENPGEHAPCLIPT